MNRVIYYIFMKLFYATSFDIELNNNEKKVYEELIKEYPELTIWSLSLTKKIKNAVGDEYMSKFFKWIKEFDPSMYSTLNTSENKGFLYRGFLCFVNEVKYIETNYPTIWLYSHRVTSAHVRLPMYEVYLCKQKIPKTAREYMKPSGILSIMQSLYLVYHGLYKQDSYYGVTPKKIVDRIIQQNQLLK